MTFKHKNYTGEKYSDGSLRVWKDGLLVCEFYVSICPEDRKSFANKQFKALVECIEKNCCPYKKGGKSVDAV